MCLHCGCCSSSGHTWVKLPNWMLRAKSVLQHRARCRPLHEYLRSCWREGFAICWVSCCCWRWYANVLRVVDAKTLSNATVLGLLWKLWTLLNSAFKLCFIQRSSTWHWMSMFQNPPATELPPWGTALLAINYSERWNQLAGHSNTKLKNTASETWVVPNLKDQLYSGADWLSKFSWQASQ